MHVNASEVLKVKFKYLYDLNRMWFTNNACLPSTYLYIINTVKLENLNFSLIIELKILLIN